MKEVCILLDRGHFIVGNCNGSGRVSLIALAQAPVTTSSLYFSFEVTDAAGIQ